MTDTYTQDDILPSAMAIARIAINEIVEKTVRLMEREYEQEFKKKYNRVPNEKDKLLLRRAVLKICLDYFANSIETMDYYQKI